MFSSKALEVLTLTLKSGSAEIHSYRIIFPYCSWMSIPSNCKAALHYAEIFHLFSLLLLLLIFAETFEVSPSIYPTKKISQQKELVGMILHNALSSRKF